MKSYLPEKIPEKVYKNPCPQHIQVELREKAEVPENVAYILA